MSRRRRAKKNPESGSGELGEMALSVAGFFALPIVGGFLSRASMQAYPSPDAGALATRTTVIDGLGAAAAMFAKSHIKDEGVQRFVGAGAYGLLFAALLNPTVSAARTLQLAPATAREAA